MPRNLVERQMDFLKEVANNVEKAGKLLQD